MSLVGDERIAKLFAYGSTYRSQGLVQEHVLRRCREANEAFCNPALTDAELQVLIASVYSTGRAMESAAVDSHADREVPIAKEPRPQEINARRCRCLAIPLHLVAAVITGHRQLGNIPTDAVLVNWFFRVEYGQLVLVFEHSGFEPTWYGCALEIEYAELVEVDR